MTSCRLHSIETMGTLDGPGIRTVFFLQGCNMKCRYCHNRDSWDTGCGTEYSVSDIVSTAESYRDYCGPDGGVTFSGGEPLLQADFLLEAVAALKEKGINTAIDTSGSVFNEKTRKLFNAADLIILDIKHADASEYPRICSFPGDNTFSNLRYLQSGQKRYWIRQVIAEGLTDCIDQVSRLRKLLQTGNAPEKIELLPYHDMGREKWTALGDDYPMEGTSPPLKEKMLKLEKILNAE